MSDFRIRNSENVRNIKLKCQHKMVERLTVIRISTVCTDYFRKAERTIFLLCLSSSSIPLGDDFFSGKIFLVQLALQVGVFSFISENYVR